ncbi:MAG TPA: hypothetical protein IAC80_01700 [Candidatus Merdiplasma excrementigallinarum]|uniref:PpiC domain-containing protein n=1 Tax=Candidatus Merdiplasma excrementigallinarum TaxID=2840864 RepID=A0A9D1T8I6_9FIRM|nr:hypothetical protein [Candidatus Merdiplasma excrementigallinarum]
MRVNWKKGLAMGLGVCMAASVLTGCGKGKELDTAAAAAALDGEEISAGLVNFFLRYQQAEFESSYGAWLQSYYGTDIWNVDLSGTGTSYGETFKNDVINSLERLLLAEKHMGDYSVELTDEEKTAITQAAQKFMESNEEEVLEKMSATQENAERLLTLYTIQNKMETQMSADVDTEVSDEEAAQRTVSYVRFTAETESDTEEAEAETETEAGSESETEAAAEAETEAAETENETAPAEDATEASLTEAAADKTESADTEEATEGAENETVSEEETEADSEASTEAETETETEELDPELAAAREEARAQAEAFLEEVKGGADFTEAAEAAAEENENVGTSTFTFGEDDTYPDEAIIEATAGLEDGTLVEQVVQVNNGFYVLRVDDAFDEAATEEKKESIVAERKSEAVNALYEEWMEEAEFTVDEDVLDQMVFDMSLTLETEAATEAAAEAESQSEAGSEAAAESQSEASTEAETEAATESVTEETVTEAETSAEEETETEAEEATESATEAETETETEA